MENESPLNIVALVLIGSLGMFIMAFTVILFVVLYQKRVLAQKNQIQAAENRHQKELLNATIQVAELEREKIARNIHDDVGTALNVLRLHLTKLSRNPNDEGLSERVITESMGLLDDSIKNIRGIAKDLMPPTLIKLGFEKGIIELCRQINASGNIRVDQDIDLRHGIHFQQKSEVQLYRIVQEVLNNIIKHSQAKLITVSIRSDAKQMEITISHDGKGITNEMVTRLTEADKGVGLKSIFSRAQLIGASVNYYSSGETDSRVSIITPFDNHGKTN